MAARKSENDAFDVTIGGEPFDAPPLQFEGNRVRALVGTWNHIYDFYEGKGVRIDDPPLEPLTEELYAKYSMIRRSRPPTGWPGRTANAG